jgi:hypothetical protein
MKVEILTENQAVKAAAFPIEVKVYEDGSQLEPSSATITVKDPEGDEYVEDQSMSIESGVGTLTYSLAATHTADVEEDAIIEVTYTISSVDYVARFLFDIVLNKLKPCIIDDDLKKYAPLLGDERWSTQSNYDTQIQEAWKIIYRAIKDKGKRPHMLIDGSQLREVHILKTLELIYFDFSKSTDDIFWEKHLAYKDRYEQQFASLSIKYDSDEDGLIEEDERKGVLGQVNFER